MNNILKYFKDINAQKQINRLAKIYENKKIVIYGAGEYFKTLQDNYDLSVLNIVGICDLKFETSKELNPSNYKALNRNELKDYDYDIILTAIYDDAHIYSDLVNAILKDTNNNDKPIGHILEPNFVYRIKNLFDKKMFYKIKERKQFLDNRSKIYLAKTIRLYNFLYDITNLKDKIKIQSELKKYKKRLKNTPYFDFIELKKCYESMIDLIKNNVYITKLSPAKEKRFRYFQLKTLKFCKKMTDFLTENEIEYFITSGTLIGAMRHNGFIPWDDDFDVGVLRKDYEKLKKICREKFKVIDNSDASISKNNRIEVIEKALKKSNGEILFFEGIVNIQLFQGTSLKDCVYLDIFPHEYYRDDYTLQEYKDYIKQIEPKRLEFDNYPDVIKFMKQEITSNPDVVEKSNKIYYSIDSLGSYVVNHTKFMKYNTIFPRKIMKFEGYNFYAPNSPEDYITVQYKDYMSFPKTIELCHWGFDR